MSLLKLKSFLKILCSGKEKGETYGLLWISWIFLFVWDKTTVSLICLFVLAVVVLCCYTGTFSSCCKWGILLISVHGLLIVVASLVVEQWTPEGKGFSSCSSKVLECGLSSCGARTYLPFLSMWDLPGSGIETMSPALAGRFSTIGLPGKSDNCFWIDIYSCQNVSTG